MKSLEQVIRYTRQCRFSDDGQWRMVLEFCKAHGIVGGNIHRALKPIAQSTYEQFVDWYGNGYGTGDIVAYGRTVGVIGDVLPGRATLMAYLDYNGKPIAQELAIDENKIRSCSEKQILDFKLALLEAKMYIDVLHATTAELYSPEKFSYVYFQEGKKKSYVGIYSHREGLVYHFLAVWDKEKIVEDFSVQSEKIIMRGATVRESTSFHQALSRVGKSFDVSNNRIINRPQPGTNNKYWYLTDRLTIALDRDNGEKRHKDRFEAGNYFFDQGAAFDFMLKVKTLIKG